MKSAMLVLCVLMLSAGCQPKENVEVGSKFTMRQLQARFYYDLGEDFLDVSGYPERQRENYEIYSTVCGQCHPLARANYAPIADREDWNRYIQRMHKRTLVHEWWTEFAKDDAEKILEFLSYDSKIRKIDRKASFDRDSARLKALFLEVQKERNRLKVAEDRRLVKPSAPYVGDKK